MSEDLIDDLILKAKMAVVLLEGVAEGCEELRAHPLLAHLHGQVFLNLLRANMNTACRESDDCVRYLQACKEEISKSEVEK